MVAAAAVLSGFDSRSRVMFKGNGRQESVPLEAVNAYSEFQMRKGSTSVVALPVCRAGEKILVDGKKTVRKGKQVVPGNPFAREEGEKVFAPKEVYGTEP